MTETDRMRAEQIACFSGPGMLQHSEHPAPGRGEVPVGLVVAGSNVSENRLRIRMVGTCPLAEATRSHTDLEGGRTTGKLLLVAS